jgi:WD40 repeat protein
MVAGASAALLFFLAADSGRRPAHAEDAAAGLVEKQVKSLGKATEFSTLVVSPGGDRLAYFQPYFITCDGKPGRKYDIIYTDKMRFSPDGKHLVYGAKEAMGLVLVVDGTEKPCNGQVCFSFSPDSKHTAYVVTVGSGKSAVVWDGKLGEPSWAIGALVFSPDSKHLAYAWKDEAEKAHAVCDGIKGPTYDRVGDPVFSPDSKCLAYAFSHAGIWGVVQGIERHGPYDGVGKPVFSPDGERLAYRVQVKDAWCMVCGKDVGPPCTQVEDPVFSIGGGRLAYAAEQGTDSFVICDGKKGREYDQVGQPVFALEGRHLAYPATREGKTFVVCNGKEGGDYGEITWLGFSPDSKHLAFAAGAKRKRIVVCDGLESPVHENVLVPEHFYDVRGKLRYVVVDKVAVGSEREAWLVEVDWPEGRTWEDAFKTKAP